MAENTGSGLITQRAVAVVIDTIIIGIAAGVLGGITAGIALSGGAVGEFIGAVVGLSVGILGLLYFIVLEARDGQTLGKKLMNIRVVKQDGGELDYVTSTIRNVLRLIDGMFLYLVGLVVILLTDHNQRLGDLAAKTVVEKA